MRPKLTWSCLLVWCSALAGWLALDPPRVAAAEANLKLEAQLIWGTNEGHSSDARHKPVDPEIRKKLQELPLKWTNYFVINRQAFDVPGKGPTKVSMSEKCEIEVRNLGNSTVKVSLFGKREHVVEGTQALPKGETLVLGGNAPNATTWLVVLKRID
jgi:hypothetical protein